MKLVADLQIHSKYAYAVSKFMVVPEIVNWAKRKGITLIGTGDCTHPLWLDELRANLEEDGTGLLRLKNQPENNLRFMLTGEISSIYSQGGRGRRVHTLVISPSFTAIEALNEKLTAHGKLISDGRPVLGLSVKKFLSYVLEVNKTLNLTDDITAADYADHPGIFIIPAHVWTPWFGLYGSKSGFDSLEECFEELTPHVRAIETGLSADIPMNWRLSDHDRIGLVSFSDAHSGINLMREATVLEVERPSFAAVAAALQTPTANQPNHIIETLEFFPEEGKYHMDGIATQELRLHPKETKRLWQEDPVLAKKVTVGVLSRVEELADRPEGFRPDNRPGYRSIIPLHEIIADILGVKKTSKKVLTRYMELTDNTSEYDLLIQLTEPELTKTVGLELAQAITAMRSGEVRVEPGYDGIFGTISITKKGIGKLF